MQEPDGHAGMAVNRRQLTSVKTPATPQGTGGGETPGRKKGEVECSIVVIGRVYPDDV